MLFKGKASTRKTKKNAIRVRRLLTLWIALSISGALSAQEFGFGYLDVDRLYDTIPALFYNDTDYTPTGRYGWDAERYRRKITQTAALIDSMKLPIIALYGVENEQVIRDISAATQHDYLYLHRTLNALDGMDFALLYEGDWIFPELVETGRRTLYVEATFDRDTVAILLCTDERLVESNIEEILAARPNLPLIVAGRISSVDFNRLGLIDRHAAATHRGWGSRRRRSGWVMRDRIATSPSLGHSEGGIYVRRWMLDETNASPIPTFIGRFYRGGAGSNLPVFCTLRLENEE